MARLVCHGSAPKFESQDGKKGPRWLPIVESKWTLILAIVLLLLVLKYAW